LENSESPDIIAARTVYALALYFGHRRSDVAAVKRSQTLGKMLAESGATTREIMSILGHDSIAHAELYTREAEQKKLASAGMQKLAKQGGEPAG
jgi:chorismate-pyruvate lyase